MPVRLQLSRAQSLRVVTTGLCVGSVAGGALLRQEMLQRRVMRSADHALLETQGSTYPELWYEAQKLDHFNESDTRTFRQRYYANFDHFQPGGPIFINIGGEGPLEDKDVNGYISNAIFAKQFGGAAIAVEHRFYGKTQPFDSLETGNLVYLKSRQALHDLAQFQTWFIASNASFAQSKLFCMGGSYPGNLAAWYRLEFPNMTSGCWSASGPVEARLDWPGFGEKVWDAMNTNTDGEVDDKVSMKLYAGYEMIAAIIQDSTPEGLAVFQRMFNVCPGSLVSQADRDSWESTITTFPGVIMQYNNTKEPKIADIRDIVLNTESAFDAAFKVSVFLNLTKGDGPGGCTDNSISAMYRMLSDTSLPKSGEGNAARTWTYQTCNEFGYFQTASRQWGRPTLYTRGASDRVLWQQVCNDVFGIDDAAISARIASTNQYYGAKAPRGITNVFFSNGELDAWSLLSVTEYPSDNVSEVYTEVAPLGSHCVGLYGPAPGEVPGATRIRDRAFALFKKWGGLQTPAVSGENVVVV